jgi:hypothetical protein
MPPRSQDCQYEEQHEANPVEKKAVTHKSKKKRKVVKHHISSKQSRFILFRIGPLRFGFHGIMGILSLILTSYALYLSHAHKQAHTPELNDSSSMGKVLSFAVTISTLAVSVGSYGLLPQVPLTSQISSWIFPPHRDAFERTIAMTGYLNLRLAHHWSWWNVCPELRMKLFGQAFGSDYEHLMFAFILLTYTNYHFLPLKADLKNGNTWVFVLPMWIGFSIDAFHQLPSIGTTMSGLKSCLLSNCINDGQLVLDWSPVKEWNTSRVDETYLLLTLLCALQIAFMFTVAFRGRMNIRTCYWVAAAEVGLLCVGLL